MMVESLLGSDLETQSPSYPQVIVTKRKMYTNQGMRAQTRGAFASRAAVPRVQKILLIPTA